MREDMYLAYTLIFDEDTTLKFEDPLRQLIFFSSLS